MTCLDRAAVGRFSGIFPLKGLTAASMFGAIRGLLHLDARAVAARVFVGEDTPEASALFRVRFRDLFAIFCWSTYRGCAKIWVTWVSFKWPLVSFVLADLGLD